MIEAGCPLTPYVYEQRGQYHLGTCPIQDIRSYLKKSTWIYLGCFISSLAMISAPLTMASPGSRYPGLVEVLSNTGWWVTVPASVFLTRIVLGWWLMVSLDSQWRAGLLYKKLQWARHGHVILEAVGMEAVSSASKLLLPKSEAGISSMICPLVLLSVLILLTFLLSMVNYCWYRRSFYWLQAVRSVQDPKFDGKRYFCQLYMVICKTDPQLLVHVNFPKDFDQERAARIYPSLRCNRNQVVPVSSRPVPIVAMPIMPVSVIPFDCTTAKIPAKNPRLYPTGDNESMQTFRSDVEIITTATPRDLISRLKIKKAGQNEGLPRKILMPMATK